MAVAPYAVFALIAKSIATLGLNLLWSLAGYVVATVFIANVYGVELGITGYLTVILMPELVTQMTSVNLIAKLRLKWPKLFRVPARVNNS